MLFRLRIASGHDHQTVGRAKPQPSLQQPPRRYAGIAVARIFELGAARVDHQHVVDLGGPIRRLFEEIERTEAPEAEPREFGYPLAAYGRVERRRARRVAVTDLPITV